MQVVLTFMLEMMQNHKAEGLQGTTACVWKDFYWLGPGLMGVIGVPREFSGENFG